MIFRFLFCGGPLDGSAFPFDPNNIEAGDDQFGGKVWLDTVGGTVGRQFVAKNVHTPTDSVGTVQGFTQHLYEITDRSIEKNGVVFLSCKHICILPEQWT